MCLYCSHLKDLRREDLRHYDDCKRRYSRWFKEDLMLLRECLIALDWSKNQDLVNRIFKQLYVGDEDE